MFCMEDKASTIAKYTTADGTVRIAQSDFLRDFSSPRRQASKT